MQIGEVKCDIDLFHGKAKNFLGIYTESAITKEGNRLLKKKNIQTINILMKIHG